jgi:hypothetical protein
MLSLNSPHAIPLVGTFAGSSVATNQEKAQPAVSEVPQGLSDEDRLRYVVSLFYWSIRHRSLARGRWVAEFEGHTWN